MPTPQLLKPWFSTFDPNMYNYVWHLHKDGCKKALTQTLSRLAQETPL